MFERGQQVPVRDEAGPQEAEVDEAEALALLRHKLRKMIENA